MPSLAAIAVVAAYVALELAFNLLLVDAAAASPAQRAAALEWLEPAGRLLGGLGCTLLLARGLSRVPGGWVAAAVLSFPLMWWGQPALLDALADASTPQQRRHAHAAMLLTDGVRSGGVSLPGLEPTGPHGVMLAVVFPLLAEGSDLPDAVLRQLRPLVEASVAADCGGGECRCSATPGRLPSAADIERCAIAPALRAQHAGYEAYLHAHRALATACAGDLRDAASCRLQREGLESRLDIRPLDPAQPLSRTAFDRRTNGEARVAAELLRRFGLRSADVPPACSQGLLAPVQRHARSCLYEPLLDRFVAQARRSLRMAPGDLQAAAAGRQAYRSMVALPLALGFSLFFGLVNAAGAIAAALSFLLQRCTALPPGAARALQLAAVAVALVAPAALVVDTERGAAERRALVARSAASGPPTVLDHGLMWVLHTEPVVYRGLGGRDRPGQPGVVPPAALRESLVLLQRTLPTR